MHRKDKSVIKWIDQPANGGLDWDGKKGGWSGVSIDTFQNINLVYSFGT